MRRVWLIHAWGNASAAVCFFCGHHLTRDTVTVDRIIPGILEGSYERGNIRPACMTCNSIQGSLLRDALRRGHDFWRRPTPSLHVPHVLRRKALTLGQVTTINYLLNDGRFSTPRIALEVGCSAATVRRLTATRRK